MGLAVPIGLGIGAIGSIFQGIGQAKQASAAQARQNMLMQMGQGMMQHGSIPEAQMQMLYQNMPQLMGLNGTMGQQFNSGQDAMMQLLSKGSGLQQLAANGKPFDTSQMFAALGPIEQRAINEQVAALRAGTGSLGKRFSSGTAFAESNLRERGAQDYANTIAQIQQQSYGDAMNRMLQASGLIGQLGGQAAGLALQGAQFNNSAIQGNITNQTGLLQLLANAGAQRNQYNLGLYQTMAGVPQAPSALSAIGSSLGDIGQLALVSQLFKGQQAAANPFAANVFMRSPASIPGTMYGISPGLNYG